MCDENKYFELKNLIILYELKFKKLKEKTNEEYCIQNISSESSSNRSFEMHLNQRRNPYQTEHDIINTPQKFQNRLSTLNNNQSTPEQSVPYFNKKKYCVQCINHKNVNESNDDHEQAQNNVSSNYMIGMHKLLVQEQKKKLETSDKSTFTVNEISTQTDNSNYVKKQIYSNNDSNNITNNINSAHLRNDKNKQFSTYSGSANGVGTESIEFNFSADIKNQKYNSSKEILQPESDGKKLLLEAYLRNNNNNNSNNNDQNHNRCSSSSSCSRPAILSDVLNNQKTISNKNDHKSETITTLTATTRESGIGTYNEDEIESLQSANQNVDDYFLSDFNEFNHKNKQITKSNKENINKLNSKEDFLTDNSDEDKMSKKYYNKKYRKKSNRKLVSSTSSSVLSSSLANSNIQLLNNESLNNTKKRYLIKSESNPSRSEFKKKHENNNKISTFKTNDIKQKSKIALATETIFNFLRKIFTLIVFLFPLFFLLAVYFFYIFFLNPSCCDLKRNYLFINIS